jgi:hypothetical protein
VTEPKYYGKGDVPMAIEYLPITRMFDKAGHKLIGNPEHFLSDHDFSAIVPIAVSRLTIFDLLLLDRPRNTSSEKVVENFEATYGKERN